MKLTHNGMKNLGWIILVYFVGLPHFSLYGQTISGVVLDKTTQQPIDYVNIGIVGENVGTVADKNGMYNLVVDPVFENDSLLFSRIGYAPRYIRIADLSQNPESIVALQELDYNLDEVVVVPKQFKQKVLGVTAKSKQMVAGFIDNLLGYECGIIVHNGKSASIDKVFLNIASCTYDSIFYRLNFYKVDPGNIFVNLLREPIYITLPRSAVQDVVEIDMRPMGLTINGDFLVTLEHVKDLGDGRLFFCAGLSEKTYFRKTSQGEWQTVPVGVSISVLANVEK